MGRERGEGALLVKEAALGDQELPGSPLALSFLGGCLVVRVQQDGLAVMEPGEQGCNGPESPRLPCSRVSSSQQGPECEQILPWKGAKGGVGDSEGWRQRSPLCLLLDA